MGCTEAWNCLTQRGGIRNTSAKSIRGCGGPGSLLWGFSLFWCLFIFMLRFVQCNMMEAWKWHLCNGLACSLCAHRLGRCCSYIFRAQVKVWLRVFFSWKTKIRRVTNGLMNSCEIWNMVKYWQRGFKTIPSSSALSSLSVSSDDSEEETRYSTFHQGSPWRNTRQLWNYEVLWGCKEDMIILE